MFHFRVHHFIINFADIDFVLISFDFPLENGGLVLLRLNGVVVLNKCYGVGVGLGILKRHAQAVYIVQEGLLLRLLPVFLVKIT
jgi:hypothetical protein